MSHSRTWPSLSQPREVVEGTELERLNERSESPHELVDEPEGYASSPRQSDYENQESYAHPPRTQDPIARPRNPLRHSPSIPHRSTEEYEVTLDWARRQGSIRQNTRRVGLIEGRSGDHVLSVNYSVPSAIQNAVERKYMMVDGESSFAEEFRFMRYTAATCDPNDFTMRDGYNLRPCMYARHTELMIAVTYYNENKVLFSRTLHSIMQNARDIAQLTNSEFWHNGGPNWQKITVCILMDGIGPCDKDVLDVLGTVGVYQDGVMKKDVNGKDTVAHIFEYTTQLSVTADQELVTPREGQGTASLPPVQMMLCLKQKNSKKLNSHRWLFTAFGRLLNPEVIICLDVGTLPGPKSLLRLWEGFYNDKDLGGCCGETRAYLGKGFGWIVKPLVAAQNFEYKISYILDKPMESTFGYVTVLPGAFSAYRYRAIMGRPLEEYFKGDPTLPMNLGKSPLGMSSFLQNMFLAEDRLLSFEIMVKAGSKWHTRFIRGAEAETDIPVSMIDFITQRRRWLNGAFAATIYAFLNFHRIHKSGHNVLNILGLYFHQLYTFVSFILSWFSVAAFLLTTFVITDISGNPPDDANLRPFPFGKATPVFNAVVQSLYTITVVVQFIMSLGSKARCHFWGYVASFLIFGVIQFYFVLNVTYLMIRIFKSHSQDGTGGDYNYIVEFYSDIGQSTVLVACISLFAIYYVSSFLYLEPWHMFTSYPQYLFVSSSYTNILNVYAFSNWHDVSWGEKMGKPAEREDAPITSIEQTLPSAQVVSTVNTQLAVKDIDKSQEDIDMEFKDVVKRALRVYVKEKEERNVITGKDLLEANRTKLVGIYIFSNFTLCILIMNDSFNALKFLGDSYTHEVWFFRIWMWSTSVTFIIRFAGSLIYFFRNVAARCCE